MISTPFHVNDDGVGAAATAVSGVADVGGESLASRVDAPVVFLQCHNGWSANLVKKASGDGQYQLCNNVKYRATKNADDWHTSGAVATIGTIVHCVDDGDG